MAISNQQSAIRNLIVLLLIFALAAFLRFYLLDGQSFWNDEGNSARIAERSLQKITEAAAGDIHPPLYYYVLHFWRDVFGSTEFALRSLSAALGVLLVGLTFLIGRKAFGAGVGLLAAFGLICFAGGAKQEREQQELGSLLRVYLLLLQLPPLRQEAMLSLPLQHQHSYQQDRGNIFVDI